MILPVTFVLVFFSKEILEVWTRNPDMVLHSSLLISLLTMGNALNGLMHLPYALQIAHGWTKLAFYQNVIAVIVLAPAIYFATLEWGSAGAAVVWLVLNMGYVLIGIHMMHRRLLNKEKWRWYFSDVLKPIGAVLTLSVLVRLLLEDGAANWATVAVLLATLCAATIAAIASSSTLSGRLSIYQFLKDKK